MSFAGDIRLTAGVIWHRQRIKRLVREVLGVPPQTLSSVAEITCDDPACPGLATQITILPLDLTRRDFVIHCLAAEVSAAHVSGIRV
ncbi:MAG: hypothetical protein GVY34_00120 [Alphaproteobacteria bacterium]|jgi:hypothetical protein|nr:hypothetical protein [Alphaproteobacteria bacterium]